MEAACEALEREFKRIGNDLEFVSHTFETEFRNKRKDMPNIINLIRSVHGLEEKMKASKFKVEQLMTRRQQVVATLTSNIVRNNNQILKVIDDVKLIKKGKGAKDLGYANECHEIEEEEFSEARAELLDTIKACSFLPSTSVEEAAVVSLPPPQTSASVTRSSSTGKRVQIASEASVEVSNIADTRARAELSMSMKGKDGPPHAQQSSGSSRFPLNITEERFNSVSVTTRGRCKLSDVNHLMEKLVAHYRSCTSHRGASSLSRGNVSAVVPALSVAELSNAGYKVSGKTGENLLNTLRTLGYLKPAKEGIALSEQAASAALLK